MTNEWHNATTDPPKKKGQYLVYSGNGYDAPRVPVHSSYQILSYAKNLYAIDKSDFRGYEGQPGWYTYHPTFGLYEVGNIWYWTELPKAPAEKPKETIPRKGW